MVKLVSLGVGEADRRHGRPLCQATVERLRERGVARATVGRGVERHAYRGAPADAASAARGATGDTLDREG